MKGLTGKVNSLTKLYKNHHNRLKVVLFFTICFISVSFFKTLYIQLFTKQTIPIDKQAKVKGSRGAILDRNNNKLAYDIDFYDIELNIKGITQEDISSARYFMKEYLDLNISNLEGLVSGSHKDKIVLLEGVPYYIVDNLKNVFDKYPQIKKSPKYKGRYYPEKELASQLIGRFSHKKNSVGLWGIERSMNESLKAHSDSLNFSITSRGHNRKNFSSDELENLSGQDVVLTIDINYQRILEQELLRYLEKTNSSSANGIIVDPYSGEILALASVPSLDLNKPFSNDESTRDYVSRYSYEPGSTLKTFSVLAGISNDVITLSEEYYCENGRYRIPNLKKRRIIQDHEGRDTLSVKEILAYSSNIGLVKMSADIGERHIYNTFKSFGFGQKTGIDFYTDVSGELKNLNQWNVHSLVSIPIGQELRVTNLQIAMAYSAIANGGFLMQPKIVLDSPTQIVRKVANRQDLDLLIESLKMTVSEGTASYMKDESICSYGKTGTAQVFDVKNNQYSDSLFISSYAGVFPCDKPRLVCVVSFIGPDKESKWASQSAVPAFSDILNRVVIKDNKLSMDMAYDNK